MTSISSQLIDVDACLTALRSHIKKIKPPLNEEQIDAMLDQLALLESITSRRVWSKAQHSVLSLVAFLQAIRTSKFDERDSSQMLDLLNNLERSLRMEHYQETPGRLLMESGLNCDLLKNQQVGLLIKNSALSTVLIKKLSKVGFDSEELASLEDLTTYLEKKRPSAIIGDLNLIEGLGSEWRRRDYWTNTPLFIMADDDELPTRLQAVRLGSRYFFKKPIDSDRLIDTLLALSEPKDILPYRVLFIDDARIMSVLYKALMGKIGVEVQTLHDPLLTLETIENFQPDVIVIDLYMPACSGLELVAILRQNESTTEIPILFLSSESDIHFQMEALNIGADDCLRKPVNETLLQVSILTRARRGRELRQSRKEHRRIHEHLKRIELAIDKHNIVSIVDLAGNIAYVNQRFCEISGYSTHELLGMNHRIVKSNLHPPEFYQELWRTICDGETWNGDICNHRKDGSHYWINATITPEMNKYGLIDRYIAISSDITAIKNMQDQLVIARDEAQSASQAKSVFLGHISHEFKTPLNSIIGFSQLLQNEPQTSSNPNHGLMLAAIERGGYHLLELINDLVDQARIETGHLKLEIESVALETLVHDCIALLKPQIQQRGITIHLKNLQSPKNVMADRVRVKQVLLNLLSNAVKYNREHGTITIACDSHLGRYRLSVKDSGCGVSRQDMAKLFQPFSRVAENETGVEGSGIGLALSKNLIERMNGSIGVNSRVGEGSEFWFTLRVASENAPGN